MKKKTIFYLLLVLVILFSFHAFLRVRYPSAPVAPVLGIAPLWIDALVIIACVSVFPLLSKEIHPQQAVKVALLVFSLLFTILLFISYTSNPPFSPDSWSYYELSKTIFTDFYNITTYRQYQFPTDYSISFPPLLPFLIALINVVKDIGIYAGYLLNLLAALATLFLLMRLSKALYGSDFLGIVLFLLLLLSRPYRDELFSARAIPLSILLVMSMLVILVEVQKEKLLFVLLGLLSGLAVLLRFDWLLPGIVLGLTMAGFFWFQRKNGRSLFANLALYFTVFTIALLPWMIYSYTHFGKWFISDNSRTVLLAIPNFVTYYYPPGTALPTLFTAPGQWFSITLVRIGASLQGLFTYYSASSFVPTILMVTTALVIYLGGMRRKHFQEPAFLKLLCFFPVLTAQIFTVLLTGYGDERYFVLIHLYFNLLLFFVITRARTPGFILFYALITSVLLLYFIPFASANPFQPIKADGIQNNLTSRQFTALLNDMAGEPDIRLLVICEHNQPNYLVAGKFGALTGETVFRAPHNLSESSVQSFIQEYQVNTVYICSDKFKEIIPRLYNVEKISSENLPLYKINGGQ